jgi:hypothetical protein
MGLKSPRSILMFESLDSGRGTDAKRGDKTKRIAGRFWHHYERGANKDWGWPINRTNENSGMGHGAD